MALLLHRKQVAKENNREALNHTALAVLMIWEKARIPTRLKHHVVAKLEGLFKEWEKLKKNKENKSKRSEGLRLKEGKWKESLDELFDIAHSNALDMIKIPEDRAFLLAQREPGRRGIMGNVDTTTARFEKKTGKKKETLKLRKLREAEERRYREEQVTLESSSAESEEESNLGDKEVGMQESAAREGDNEQSSSGVSGGTRNKRGRKNIIDEKLAVSLDMAKVSDRGAALVLTPTIQSLGLDPSDYNLNYSSIRRERMKCRQKIAEGLKADFTTDVPLTIHWDGKMLEDISGTDTVDRLPILVSGNRVLQLLAVAKLPSGTGAATASAVYDASMAWGICDKVKCMSFDTTASNTGPRNGACILLEQKMDKDMLWLACRHHMLEIVLESVVVLCLGSSQAPEILLFKRFKKAWSTIDRATYQTALSDEETERTVCDSRDSMIAFVDKQLKTFQPRDDYRELLQLTSTFLKDSPAEGVRFRAPAGLHRARWMAKAIYALKIWMFRGQIQLTKKEEVGIRDICLFTVLVYVKAWFTAQSSAAAPRHDLQLLKAIDEYKHHHAAISAAALKKFLGHLWYLSPELIALSFFDDNVSHETKRAMVRALDTPGEDHPQKRITVDPLLIQSKELEDFVSSATQNFFTITGIPSTFLCQLDVASWDENDEYKVAKSIVTGLKVTNDLAERGVALMDEYNKLHTNDEEQKQFLLLIVQKYRQQYHDRKKSTLAVELRN